MEDYLYWGVIFGISIGLVGLIIVSKIRNARSQVSVKSNSMKIWINHSSKLLDAFVTAYHDKIRLEEQWRRLDKSLQQGMIPQRTFHDKKRTLDRELSQVEDKVKILRAQLREEGKSYRDFIDKLEFKEIEKSALLISMDELTSRNIVEPMSKESLERLQKEYDIKFQRLTNQIEKILTELQESTVLEPGRLINP